MFELGEKDNVAVAAIDENENRITYGEIVQFSKKLNDVIPQRCLVFSLCTNSIGSLAGYASFIENRIVPLLLAAKLDSGLFQYLVETYQPAFIWAPAEETEKISGYEKVFEAYGYVLYRTGLKGYPLYDELALLLTTSGSTGSPKLVRQSYKNIEANTKSIVEYLELDETERPITTLPMNYTYGLSIVNTHLYVGATILLTEKTLMQKEFWKFFKEQKATSFGGVPYIYEMLAKLRFFRMNLPSLRYMTQAGGKLLPELHRQFAEYAQERGCKFIVMYGQTEATARMAYLPAEKSLEKYGSMGIAIPGGRFELIDVDDSVIQNPGIVGELVYYGDNVTLGYAEHGEDLIHGDERNGVLVTGDMAKRDEDGFYFITGRKKRFLKIYGNRVNMDEVERLIRAEYPQDDCACGGIDDKMYIYLVKDRQEDAEKIRKFVAGKTGLNSNAFAVYPVAMIPRNDAGKILYSKLEELRNAQD